MWARAPRPCRIGKNAGGGLKGLDRPEWGKTTWQKTSVSMRLNDNQVEALPIRTGGAPAPAFQVSLLQCCPVVYNQIRQAGVAQW
jgi:hypothetical protein